MIDQSEPLERLRAANPVLASERSPVPAASSPDAVALFRRIVGEETAGAPARPLGRTRAARRARPLVPAVLVALVTGTVAYGLTGGRVSKPQTAACFQRADLTSRTEVVRVDARGPAAACADLWARGVFGGAAVPTLAECALPSGTVGVFPTTGGPGGCGRLGLGAPTPAGTGAAPEPTPTSSVATAPTDVNVAFLAFRDAVLPRFLDEPCVAPDAALDLVRRELDRAGLGDWTVRTGQGVGDGFSPDRPCATLAFRPAEHQVVLVPSPPRR